MPHYSPTKRASFGQRVRETVGQSSAKGGAGRALSIRFNNWWKPPKNQTTKIRLLPGDYETFDGGKSEYFMYAEHWCERARKSLICSKQHKKIDGVVTAVGGNCLCCDEIDDEAGDINWRVLHVFNGIHLAHYHLEPVTDKNGKPMVRPSRDGKQEPIYQKVECEGRRCNYCKKKLKRVFGKKIHWSIGSGHLGDLSGVVEEIEKDCSNCGGEGTIEAVTHECRDCGEVIIDLDTTDLNKEEIRKITCRPYTCPECKTRGLLLEQSECSGCDDPEPLSIFDCDIEIKRTGEGTQSSIQIPRWNATELTKEMLDEFGKPYPFEEIFKGDPFKIQAKILKVKNKYEDDTDKHTKDYEEGESDSDKPNYD